MVCFRSGKGKINNMGYQEELNRVLAQKFAGIIAFSGGSSEELESRVKELVEQAVSEFRGLNVAILTGGTKWGVPKYATQKAKDLALPVIGVYPSRGAKYALNNLDFALEVPPRFHDSEWGDETEVFAKLAQGVVMIGGSFGTAIEFSHIMKANERRIKNNIEPVYIAPLSIPGANSFADLVYQFSIKPEMRICIPEIKPSSGHDAASFLIKNLELR